MMIGVTYEEILEACRGAQGEILQAVPPPDEGVVPDSQHVVPFSVVAGTRGYIERVVHQINGAYQWGWYDACAVMIRRLLETLIIEVYEHYKIADRIKNANGDFFYLGDLIACTLSEGSWNLGRDTRRSLPKLKDIGDKSAHSRRFNAHRADIEKHLESIRYVVQELVYLADLK